VKSPVPIKKRPPGRPPTGKVLVGFKLSPELVELLRRAAHRTKQTKSAIVEEALKAYLER